MIIGNHKHAVEYDGAFKCLNCNSQWGALSNASAEPPAECRPITLARDLDDFQRRAMRMVDDAADVGVVLSIEQVPALPLAMGNYTSVVSVRPARGKS